MFASLAPARVNGFMVGVWWVFLAFASILGGLVAQVISISKEEAATMNLTTSLNNYTNLRFYKIFSACFYDMWKRFFI